MFVLLWVFAGSARAQSAVFDPDARYRVTIDGAPARGPADALITIVEFSDFACQYCRRSQRTLASLERLYPDQLRVVFRHNPMDADEGTLAAEASMAAHEQGLFWAMHDRIFEAGGVVTRSQLEGFALELGLDITRLRRALDDRSFRAFVRRDATFAWRLGIQSTPMFFINGRPIRGAQPLRVFVAVVEQERARARALVEDARAANPAANPAAASGQVYAALMQQAHERADADPRVVPAETSELDDSRAYRVGTELPGHGIGPADPLVTVVVFSDFQCPFCRKFLPMLRAMRAEHPTDVRVVFRHFPLDFHPDAQLASEAAVAAAAQGRFWQMHDLIYQHQDRLSRADLDDHARRIGLDTIQFSRDLDVHRYSGVVADDRAVGGALGVSATPFVFFNGVPLRGGRSYDAIKHLYLDVELAKARALVAGGVARADVYETVLRNARARDSARGSEAGSRPAGAGSADDFLQNDPDEELMIACAAGDGERAHALYRGLGDEAVRDRVRTYCRPYGVDFP